MIPRRAVGPGNTFRREPGRADALSRGPAAWCRVPADRDLAAADARAHGGLTRRAAARAGARQRVRGPVLRRDHGGAGPRLPLRRPRLAGLWPVPAGAGGRTPRGAGLLRRPPRAADRGRPAARGPAGAPARLVPRRRRGAPVCDRPPRGGRVHRPGEPHVAVRLRGHPGHRRHPLLAGLLGVGRGHRQSRDGPPDRGRRPRRGRSDLPPPGPHPPVRQPRRAAARRGGRPGRGDAGDGHRPRATTRGTPRSRRTGPAPPRETTGSTTPSPPSTATCPASRRSGISPRCCGSAAIRT